MVDTLGLLWAVVITPVSMQDWDGGREALAEFRRHVRFTKVVWADGTYAALAQWALVQWLWLVELVERPTDGFQILPKRWIVERTFGRLNRSRRLAKSYERTPESDRAFLQIAMIHLMIKRLA